MARTQILTKPPVLEALIDVVFTNVSSDEAKLRAIAEKICTDTGKISEIKSITHAIGLEDFDRVVASRTTDFDGFKIHNDPCVVQLRGDRVTVSQVGLYDSWEKLVAHSRGVVKAFVSATGAERAGRIAARFINRIPLSRNLGELLEHPPVIDVGIGSAQVDDFMTKMSIKGLERGIRANLTVGTATNSQDNDERVLIVDVDVYIRGDFSSEFDEISAELDSIRSVKNDLFFGTVTDVALEQFK